MWPRALISSCTRWLGLHDDRAPQNARGSIAEAERPLSVQLGDLCQDAQEPVRRVESRCGAVAVGRTYLYPPLSSGGASLVRPWLRFDIPLIEPDRRIYRIRLSDKTSRLHPRRATTKLGQAYEPKVLVKVREWISSALASPDLVLEAQPPAQPHSRVVVERPIRIAGGSNPKDRTLPQMRRLP